MECCIFNNFCSTVNLTVIMSPEPKVDMFRDESPIIEEEKVADSVEPPIQMPAVQSIDGEEVMVRHLVIEYYWYKKMSNGIVSFITLVLAYS